MRRGASPTAGPARRNRECSASMLSRLAVSHFVKQRDAVGLGPKAHFSSIGESGILDLEHLLAVERHAEARAFEVDTQAVPGIRRHRYLDPVAALAANDIERTADTPDGLVENDVVFQRVGAGHVIVVRISCPSDDAGRAVLGPGDRLELHFDEAVLALGAL